MSHHHHQPSMSVQYKFRIVTDGPGEVQLETHFNPAAFVLSQNVSQGNAPPVDFDSDELGSLHRRKYRQNTAEKRKKPHSTGGYKNGSVPRQCEKKPNSYAQPNLPQHSNGIESDDTDEWLNQRRNTVDNSTLEEFQINAQPVNQYANRSVNGRNGTSELKTPSNTNAVESDQTDNWLNHSNKTNGVKPGYYKWETPKKPSIQDDSDGLYNSSLINDFQNQLSTQDAILRPQVSFTNATKFNEGLKTSAERPKSFYQLKTPVTLGSDRFHSQETVKLADDEDLDQTNFPRVFQKRRQVIDQMLKSRFDTPTKTGQPPPKPLPKSTSFTMSTPSGNTPINLPLKSRIVSETVTETVDIQQTETVKKEFTAMTTLRNRSSVPTAL